eukprot:507579_1
MSLLQSSTPLTGQTGSSVKIDKLKKKKKKDKGDGNGNGKKPLPDLAMMKNGHGIAYKGELCGGKVDSVVCADGCHCDLDKSKKFFGEHVGNCIGTCPSRQEINAAANIIEIVYSDGSHETHNLDKAGIGYYDYQSQDLYGVPHYDYQSQDLYGVPQHALGYSPQIYDAMPVLIVAVMMAFVCVCVICSGIAAFGCVGCYSFGRKQAEAERQKKADYEELTV